MLVMLPPSEAKTSPRRGRPVDVDALSFPALAPVRRKVVDALAEVSGRPDALELLGVGASLADEVARNTSLHQGVAGPARRVYTGVLYGAAGLDRLTPTGRARAAEHVRIVSGLWGVVTPEDVVPAYRLSMGTDLPGIGSLAAAWRAPLAEVLDPQADGQLVVDCRSAAYLAAWTPPRSADWVTVRVERELDGVRSVVSHHAKHTRGVLTRHLLTRRGRVPRDAEQLARVASELVGDELLAVELAPRKSRGARVLSLVVA
ncbi:YaaA family protein [Cellulomonas rhizosphaerae]|uniref:Peroxide stress protein YaaA n=1 Tax=Cellulomonas rhizosphaerae TaxID=2293719 RepID=A0A413RHC6_9CELL|nr:peroxide stress protein YaaA [Cellulomonas rhizosphaerae]RHA37541.1 peroxide stress protein YaaA [Cellulomonas rhizosphaerae]